MYNTYNLSPKPVDILSFDSIFLETDSGQGMIFENKRAGIFHNFNIDVDTGYNYNEKFRGGVQWYASVKILFQVSVLKQQLKMVIQYHLMVNQKLFIYQSKKINFLPNKGL